MSNIISIREYCIPAYDWISRTQKAAEKSGINIPAELTSMEQKTAGGICEKVAHFWAAEFWDLLPEAVVIESGVISDFVWVKEEQGKEAQRISLILAD